MTNEQTLALAAAGDAAEAAAELIRFAREGDALPSMAFTVEVVAHLAAALRGALDIEIPRLVARDIVDPSAERETAEQLLSAIAMFEQVWG